MQKNRIKNLKKAAKITKYIFAKVKSSIKPGVSENEISLEIEKLIKKNGLKLSFRTIVASGPNGAKPHAKPTDRKIKRNDIVVVDFGVIYKNCHSDMTRTVIVGKISLRMRMIYNAVKNAQRIAIRKCRAGIRISEFVKCAHGYIRKRGFEKYMLHSLGHGLGLKVHQSPKLSEKNRNVLKENSVITIEPGLYVKGRGGVRIEDAVLVTKRGARVLAP